MRKTITTLATSMLLGMASPITADEGMPAPGIKARATMTCAGQTFAIPLIESDAAGRFAFSSGSDVPYVKSVSVDDAGARVRVARDEVRTGTKLTLSTRPDGKDLLIDFDGETTELKRMRAFEAAGHRIDLPEVQRCAYAGTERATRTETGWRMQGGLDLGNVGLVVDILPVSP